MLAPSARSRLLATGIHAHILNFYLANDNSCFAVGAYVVHTQPVEIETLAQACITWAQFPPGTAGNARRWLTLAHPTCYCADLSRQAALSFLTDGLQDPSSRAKSKRIENELRPGLQAIQAQIEHVLPSHTRLPSTFLRTAKHKRKQPSPPRALHPVSIQQTLQFPKRPRLSM